MSEPLLSVRNLETYYGPITAIRGVSFDVTEGQIVTILGANGAGKTTVLKSVCGAMEAQKGTISFAGRSVTGREPDWVARQGIAHVPEGREIFPFMTVKGNLMMGAYSRHDRGGIERDLDIVYGYFPVLRERQSSQAGYLSGGQQQMLAIGRLNQEQKVTMLLVEQNANMALKTAHYGYVLEVGRIVLEGACEKLVENEDVREFYLGHKETAVRGKKRWKRTKRWR
jgi:branched-chain amino acid transport system ATP-binding protein